MKEKQQTQEKVQVEESQVSVIEGIMQKSKYTQGEESYSIAKRGVAEFLTQIVKSDNAEEKVNKLVLDEMIAHIDSIISRQMDEIIHNKQFQQLESTWRGLQFLVERTNFEENIKINILDATKEEIYEDFKNNLDITQSTMYKELYSLEYGQFGGEPYGAVIGDYQLSSSVVDMEFLNKMASVSAMSHAPFITSMHHNFFGLDNYADLANIKDLNSLLDGPQYTKWRTFRENEDAKYTGLVVTRYLGRAPYDSINNPIKTFSYAENVLASHNDMLWSNAAYLFATRLTDRFANYRWCGNIIGPQSGGEVRDLPLYFYESFGREKTKIPTEVLITDRREFELSENGFIVPTLRRGSNNATFFSANSPLKPKKFTDSEDGRAAQMNYLLSTQLPYFFLNCRMAHYIKVLRREEIGSWKSREDIERGANEWIKQYISDQENPPPEVRSKRPFREAKVIVTPSDTEAGWYHIKYLVKPHFKFMGSYVELSLVGKIEKE